MRISITHSTTYTYAKPVLLAPHVIRLRPRCDGALWLTHFDIRIQPQPSALSQCFDLEGNTVSHAWFDGKTDRLQVTSRSEVETLRTNAFDYVLDPQASRLPPRYTSGLERLLAPYSLRAESNDQVDKFAQEIAYQAGGNTLYFLDGLSQRLYETCSRIIRETGKPQEPAFTLQLRQGSCRDLTVLFIDACRAVGIAARFVSGYRRYGRDPAKRYMHAWPEVFLPGGGWRGYDPTQSTLVTDLHVAVAASHEPAGAAPIQGAYFGESVPSKMEAWVQIGDQLPQAPIL
jgi:transglutaminase-like putative cysteine protease